METIILANWKANLSPAHARSWLAAFRDGFTAQPGIKVILALPALLLPEAGELFAGSNRVSLAAQDISPYPPGSYTGATPAAWLADLVDFVLVGHQERRRYFHETVQDVAAKVREAVDAGITPIVCMDEAQFAGQLAAIEPEDEPKMVVAYTPKDAVQLEIAHNKEGIARICSDFAKRTGGCPVLYGGGVNTNNAASLASLPALSGLMVAGAGIDPREFLAIIEQVAAQRA